MAMISSTHLAEWMPTLSPRFTPSEIRYEASWFEASSNMAVGGPLISADHGLLFRISRGGIEKRLMNQRHGKALVPLLYLPDEPDHAGDRPEVFHVEIVFGYVDLKCLFDERDEVQDIQGGEDSHAQTDSGSNRDSARWLIPRTYSATCRSIAALS